MTEPKDDSKENESSEKVPTQIQNEWMIRRCAVYDEEYSDCTSIRARFNQYFIHGETVDCGQWKQDSINCYKWVDNSDVTAANELVKSEQERRKQRLLPHYTNDTWERRKAPPDDWNKPLPEFLLKQYETSYLNVKAKELRGEVPPSFDIPGNPCNIL